MEKSIVQNITKRVVVYIKMPAYQCQIKPTDGRCRKNSPYYNKKEKTPEELILERLKPLKISELRKEA